MTVNRFTPLALVITVKRRRQRLPLPAQHRQGVAPKEVKSSDIYWGAMPWIGLQAIMVAVVIAFPITVTGLLDAPTKVDLDKIKIEIPDIELPPPLDFGQPKN